MLRPLFVILGLTIACSGPKAAEPAAAPAPAPAATPAPAAPAPSSQEGQVKDFVGKWTYAKDPQGKAPFDSLYEGSTMDFRADGSYVTQLGGGEMKMEGKWTVRSSTDDETILDIVYSPERKTVYHVVPRKKDGKVTGLLIYEGEDKSIPPRWVVPAS